jgi:hypothetical protein
MIFRNHIPITELGQQWIDDQFPPDEWYVHHPGGIHPCLMPEDLYDRFCFLVLWYIYESAWDQLYRSAQVSSTEAQHVVDYLQTLGKEESYEVPARLSDVDFAMPIQYCEWGPVWSRYPEFVILHFTDAGYKLNPTHPLDDERHPQYIEYESIRQNILKSQPIQRIKKDRTPIDKAE